MVFYTRRRFGRRYGRYGKKYVKRFYKKKSTAITKRYGGKRYPIYRDIFSQRVLRTKLRYCETNLSIDPAAEALSGAGYSFSFNSIFDPNETGVGHQAMNLDYYSNFYNMYRVVYSVIKVTVVNHYVNTVLAGPSYYPNYALRMAITRDLSISDLPDNMNDLWELCSPSIRRKICGPSLTGRLPTMKMTCVPYKVANLDRRDDTLSSLCTATPAREIFGNFYISSADGATNPPAFNVNIEMTYLVEFFDPKLDQTQN